MDPVKFEKLLEWSGGKLEGQNESPVISGISTDSRNIKPGQIFIPLKGENFDGHLFIEKALNNGASAYITAEEPKGGNIPAIKVNDTLKAYQSIAKSYLAEFDIPKVAITGSNGKTTTKEIIAQVLSKKYKTVATEKNFNNEVGVPQTIMNVDSTTEAFVVELGMRGLGQIAELATIVRPDIAVITNIGESHFELLGSYEAIAQAKCEILECMNPVGISILNADDKWFDYSRKRAKGKTITFGINNEADIKLISKQSAGIEGFELEVIINDVEHNFNLPLLGIHNIYNALAAISVASAVGMDPREIAAGLLELTPADKRMEVKTSVSGWVVLNDTYNASPSSMKKALEILRDLPKYGRKIAVLGDMLELGEISIQSHREIGRLIKSFGIDELYVVGELGCEIADGAKSSGMNGNTVSCWPENKELSVNLKKKLAKGDQVLIKGSRRMKMEEIAESLLV